MAKLIYRLSWNSRFIAASTDTAMVSIQFKFFIPLIVHSLFLAYLLTVSTVQGCTPPNVRETGE